MAFLWVLLAFGLWAGVHTLLAAEGVKMAVRRRIGERAYAGFYRLAYNLFSLLSIVPVFVVLATVVPSTTLWRWPWPFTILAVGVQLVGLVGLLLSLWQTDIWRFAGLRQAVRFLQGAEAPDPPAGFVRSGTYSLVRHPLYFFSLLVLWFMPLMTLNLLLFNVLATLYFWIGSLHEERRLLAEFGEEYRHYQQEVPHLIPFTR